MITNQMIDNIWTNVKINYMFNKRLCYCKELILKEYLHKNKFYLINIIQEFEKIIDNNEYDFDLEVLDFEKNFGKFLCDFKYISKKVLSIFIDLEKIKLKLFKNKILDLEKELKKIKNKKEKINFLYNNIVKELMKWVEISILLLVAFNINCDNYKNDKKLYKNCNNIDFCYTREFKNVKCEVHEELEKYGDFLHIFITNEILFVIDEYLEILKKYYDYTSKNISIIIDYNLIEDYKFDKNTLKRFKMLSEKYKNIYVINYEHLFSIFGNFDLLNNIEKSFKNVYLNQNPFEIFFKEK